MIFINQIRQKIGVMFGNPETTSGGLALKFYSSVRLEIRKLTGVKEGEETVGSRVKVKVVKNKVAPPFRTAEFDLMFDKGISWEGDLLDLAVEDKLIEKSGAYFSISGDRVQGREKAKDYLSENPKVVEELRAKILEKRGLTAPARSAEDNGEGEREETSAPHSRRAKASANSAE
jgi:recombination protein RecA